VLLSGLLWGGKPGKILDMVRDKRILLVLSKPCYIELMDKLIDKFNIPVDRAQEWLMILFEEAILVEVGIKIDYCKDVEDNKFLEAAIAGKARFIVTGNTKHFDKEVKEVMLNKHKIHILRVAEFIKTVG
jgi:putative PIN family toxin of toxin-antitoxin system